MAIVNAIYLQRSQEVQTGIRHIYKCHFYRHNKEIWICNATALTDQKNKLIVLRAKRFGAQCITLTAIDLKSRPMCFNCKKQLISEQHKPKYTANNKKKIGIFSSGFGYRSSKFPLYHTDTPLITYKHITHNPSRACNPTKLCAQLASIQYKFHSCQTTARVGFIFGRIQLTLNKLVQ